MLKYYFQLIRLPGIFTVFSNIILGYFLVSDLESSYYLLAILFTISGMLYSSGMIFNDYFDYRLDKKQNPLRPLSSGKISKKSALILGILLFITANLLSLSVGFQTILISLIITGLILSYNFSLKHKSVIGIPLLGLIRSLTVILGASIVTLNFEIVLFVIPIGIFVAGLSILAKTETSILTSKYIIINVLFITATIVYVTTIFFDKLEYYSLILLLLFLISISIPYLSNKKILSKASKKLVTSQLLSIILLDAALLSFVMDPIMPIITASLFVPSYIISRKLYLS